MFKDLIIGTSMTLPLGLIAVANPEYLGVISNNKITNSIVEKLYLSGFDLSEHTQSLTLIMLITVISLIVALVSYLMVGRFTGSKNALNKNIQHIFDAIENGREQIGILDASLRDKKFGNINTRAFEKLGHSRRILDALEHRARQLAPFYRAINSRNQDQVIDLLDKPLKFSFSCVNSLRDTQSIEIIPDILPHEAIVKLDLFFNGIRREIEESESQEAKATDLNDIFEEHEHRPREVIAA